MTIIDNLQNFAINSPSKIAFSKILNDDLALQSITFKELDDQSSSLSSAIKTHLANSLYIVVLLPQGLDFIITILAIFKAGKIAVPCSIPKRKNSADRLLAILEDSGSKDIICSKIETSRILNKNDEENFKGITWWNYETLIHQISPNNISVSTNPTAYVQYTSGSTGNPKGAVISHANLLHNSALSQKCFQTNADIKSISWLPNFHDWGLIDGVFQPIFLGFQGFLMTTIQFIKNPRLWLHAITEFEIDYTTSPNFGLDFVCDRISDNELSGLDLSKLRTIFTASEPIRWNTLKAFTEKFTPVGFNNTKFMTGYGMAEATLYISISPIDTAPIFLTVDNDCLKENRISLVKNGHILVSSGKIHEGFKK